VDPFSNEIDDLIDALPENMRSGIVQVQIQPQGNSTVVTNFARIIKDLQREPSHLRKFISTSLGVQTVIDGNQLVLKAKISANRLDETLKSYVKQFVICPNCKKPDTLFETKKKKNTLSCLACGHVYSWKT
jgi:translation initiation factor 2 subunit 2